MSPGPSHPPSRVPAPAQRGFSLLGVLVAVTVLSFGVLGVVAALLKGSSVL